MHTSASMERSWPTNSIWGARSFHGIRWASLPEPPAEITVPFPNAGGFLNTGLEGVREVVVKLVP